MAVEVKLPALSESVSEGVVSEVRVKPGDNVTADSIICVVEAEKSAGEVPAGGGGTIAEVAIQPGDKVQAGQLLCRIQSAAGAKADAKAEAKQPEPVRAAATPNAVGSAARNGERVAATRSIAASQRWIPAGPATRRLARKLGVALEQIRGTGPRGRVTQDDVIAFSRSAAPTSGPTIRRSA